MKYLITGGAGFIGSHLVDKLISQNHKVVIIDNLLTGKKENINPSAKFYKYDILDSRIKEVFEKEKPQVVFHFAAHIEARQSAEDPIFDAKTNVLGSLNILENCRNFGIKKIIFSSSGGEVYGDAKIIPTPESYEALPISPYGVAKLTVEKYLYSYLKMYDLNFVALRYGNIYGPRQNPYGEAGVIAIFLNKMLNKKQPLIHGNGKQTKDYVFINDVISATISASKKNINGAINIATGKETSVLEIFNKLKKMTGFKGEKKHVPLPVIGFKRGALSIKMAKKTINWQPEYNLEKGLQETFHWFKYKYEK